MQHNVWERRLRARAPEYKQKQRTRTLRITNENVPNQVTDSETASVWTKRLRARAHEYKRQNIDSKKRTRTLRSKKENFPNQVTDSETASIWTTRLRARAPGSEIKSLVLTKRKKTKILEQTKSALNVDQSKQFDEHEKTLRDIFDKPPVVDRNKLSDQDDQEEFRAKYQQQDNDWGQSPELESALIRQRSIDPDYIFGEALPLNIEEIFGSSPFPRSSSANWTSDALLLEEDLEYKELMGYIEF